MSGQLLIGRKVVVTDIETGEQKVGRLTHVYSGSFRIDTRTVTSSHRSDVAMWFPKTLKYTVKLCQN